MPRTEKPEVIIIGGGLAGLSAATYLGRALRDTLVVDFGRSMARWEPDVQNYLGFPGGINGAELLRRARQQARRYHVRFARDTIVSAKRVNGGFRVRGQAKVRTCRCLLLATGIFHIPPDIPGVRPCLGHSMFFCKDCDGHRVRGKPIAVYGWTNEAVEYALALIKYSPSVALLTDGRRAGWDEQHDLWLKEHEVPVFGQRIVEVDRCRSLIRNLILSDGTRLAIEALFTTRGDLCRNKLAKSLGAEVDPWGQIIVDQDMRTTVPGAYAAGCVTPSNCQMIIAAGQGATAAQAINRDLFEKELAGHSLRRFRLRQLSRNGPGPEKHMRRVKTPFDSRVTSPKLEQAGGRANRRQRGRITSDLR